MPYFTITDFAAGLDLRRSPLTAPPGTLRKLVNCHVSPGGEIEKRYAFQFVANVDPLSRGIMEINGQLYVFKMGTGGNFYPAATALPPTAPPVTTPPGWGIGTINLQAMSAADSGLTEVMDYDIYKGRVFVITRHDASWPTPEYIRRFYGEVYLKQVANTPGPPIVYSKTHGIFGQYCRTYKDKMYVVEGSLLGSSCVGLPDWWVNRPETDPPTGVKTAGWFQNDLSTQDSDMNSNTAIEVYYSKLAIMGKNATQLWQLDPDPSKDQYDSTLRGTGTMAWRSVLQYGSGDVMYLAPDGIRSLRARDSSLAASVSDVGSPIDPLIQQLHREWGEYNMSQAISILQPITGRVWVILPLANDDTGARTSRIFVLSAFPGPKITAWSEYRPNFNVVAACTHLNRVVLRDDQHRVWVYGSMTDTSDPTLLYDACPVEVVFPFHAGQDPATRKRYMGLDASCEGDWQVFASYQPSTNSPDGDAEAYIGQFTDATFEMGRMPMEGWSTHLSLRLRSGKVDPYTLGTTGKKTLSNLTIHYQLAESG